MAPSEAGTAQVRRVRIALLIGEGMVLSVIGNPGDDGALDSHRAEHRKDRA